MFLLDDKPIAPAPCPLTKRQLEVLWLFFKRMKNKDVSRKLPIKYNTVRTHRKNIFKRLKANGKYDAVEIAKENNWWGYTEVLERIA